jgi:group I intron endonuclease
MYSVYQVTNLVNNKIYVGKTRRKVARRWHEHVYDAITDTKRYFYKAVRKYGESGFSVRTLEEAETNDAAAEIEKFWIRFFSSSNPKFGYNGTEGGDGSAGYRHTPEAIAKMREAKKGCKLLPHVVEALRNRRHTPDEIARQIAKQKGKKHSLVSRQAMSDAQRRVEIAARQSKKQSSNTSGFIGVTRCKKDGKWFASMRSVGRSAYLGSFNTAEEAALVRDTAALDRFGEYAILNFPRAY